MIFFSDDGEDLLYLYNPKTGAVSSVNDPFSEANSYLVRPSTTGIDKVRIGKNSLTIKERNGKQELYAEDDDGSPIPINVINSSELQANEISAIDEINKSKSAISKNAADIDTNRTNVEANRRNINDLGSGVAGATALTAALSSLPVAADDTPFSCGVGTGGYSSRFAVSIGCAARLNERLSLNVGGSHVVGWSSNYGGGSLDTVAAHAGFVFKLGAIHKHAIAYEEQLQSQLDEVKNENAAFKANYSYIQEQNRALIARLERLEVIALALQAAITTSRLK